MWTQTFKAAKRLVIFVVGMTVVLFGIALIALPGPAIIVIPLGLAILATEFVWARTLLKKVKASMTWAKDKVTGTAGQHVEDHAKQDKPPTD